MQDAVEPGGVVEPTRWGMIYLALQCVLLGLVVVLGHFGGKIVFYWKKGRC